MENKITSIFNESRTRTRIAKYLGSTKILHWLRACTTPRRRRRFALIAPKYVFMEGIQHGERGEPSRRSSTAFARSPRRVDASARRCMILLQLSAGGGDPVRPFYPSLRFGPHLHAHSWCKSPTASFLCCCCCARRAAAAPVLPAEGEMTWHGCSTILPCACSSAPSLHVLQHYMLAACRSAPLSLRFVF